MGKLRLPKLFFIIFMAFAPAAVASPINFTSIVSFNGTNGSSPYYETLIQGIDGNLYGTTAMGGSSQLNCYGETCGTVFKITPAGTLTTLHDFSFADGGLPEAGLIQTTNGDFYSTATVGGSTGFGTIFKITSAGNLTTVYQFQNSTDGGNPLSPLVQGTDGAFYGTTSYGGGDPCACGTVFKLTSGGTLTTLHTFVSDGSDGNYPEAGLALGADGNFYGTTARGGTNGYGTVFKITSAGTLTTLYSFASTDGAYPEAGLVQGTDGNFYGTTSFGGDTSCQIFGCGTVFKITPTGTLTTLHNFAGADGSTPLGVLALATNGMFYGTTDLGGVNNLGTIFAISSAGALTTLYNFDGTGGGNPQGGLLQATNGTFYGTTTSGGGEGNCTGGCGTVFSLSIGLGPFVETLPRYGKVGDKIIILGNNLTNTTGVTFDGTPAMFTVAKSSAITATVPPGATTGTVEVTTADRTLKSNVPFKVVK